MRPLYLLTILLLCAYYFHRPATPAVVAVPEAARATPPAHLKLYYHSPLDAPAMAAGVVTGVGYYSTSEDSGFGQGARLDGGAAQNTRLK